VGLAARDLPTHPHTGPTSPPLCASIAMPTHHPQDPGNIPSVPSSELRKRTPYVAPGEAARSRHRQPPITIAAPLSPPQALQSSVVVGISPPFRRNRPRPSWILATTRQPKPVRVSLGQAVQRGGLLWWGGHGVQALIPKACSLYDALRN